MQHESKRLVGIFLLDRAKAELPQLGKVQFLPSQHL